MKIVMEKGYDERSDLYCKDITNYYHCKDFPNNPPLGHKSPDNLQKFLLCACPDKASPTITPLAPDQTALQKILEECVHDNFQIEHQQSTLKFLK